MPLPPAVASLQGGNSIEQSFWLEFWLEFWLHFWLEKRLEKRLEITIFEFVIRVGNLKPKLRFFKLKLKPKFVRLNRLPARPRPQLVQPVQLLEGERRQRRLDPQLGQVRRRLRALLDLERN